MNHAPPRWLNHGGAPPYMQALLRSASEPEPAVFDAVWQRVEASVATGSAPRVHRPPIARLASSKVIALAVVVGAVSSAPGGRVAISARPAAALRAVYSGASVEPSAPLPPTTFPTIVPGSLIVPFGDRNEPNSTSASAGGAHASRRVDRMQRERRSGHDGNVTAPSPGGAFGDELVLLAEARRAVDVDPSHALGLVGEYGLRFPHGTLGHECEAVAVAALVRLRQWNAATVRADRFLAEHPDSTMAPRVRMLRDVANEQSRLP